MIRRIRDLLYDQGFTISGARNKLQEPAHPDRGEVSADPLVADVVVPSMLVDAARDLSIAPGLTLDPHAMREELFEIRALLSLN